MFKTSVTLFFWKTKFLLFAVEMVTSKFLFTDAKLTDAKLKLDNETRNIQFWYFPVGVNIRQ